MERINYRITLDAHKSGIQRMLQGFETADDMARRISVNLVAGGDTYEIPQNNVAAVVYVTTPDSTEPSINDCTIEGNTIIYDVLPIAEAGITEMQIKLIETSMEGAKRVLLAPKFAVEVTESNADDEGAEQTAAFTALENAIAKASGVYDTRLLNIEIGTDYVFRAYYADGKVYENAELYMVLSRLSESWAVGGTGVRVGEDTDNSMYYSEVSKTAAETARNASTQAVDTLGNAQKVLGETEETLTDTKKVLRETEATLEEMKKETPDALVGRVETLESGKFKGDTARFGISEKHGMEFTDYEAKMGEFPTDEYSYNARRLIFSYSNGRLYADIYDNYKLFYGDSSRVSGSYSGTGVKRNISVSTNMNVSQQLILVHGNLGMGFISPSGSVWISRDGSVNYEYDTYYNGYSIVMSADSFFNSMNDPYNYTIVYT